MFTLYAFLAFVVLLFTCVSTLEEKEKIISFSDWKRGDQTLSQGQFEKFFSLKDNDFIFGEKGSTCTRAFFKGMKVSCNELENDSISMNKAAILLTKCDMNAAGILLPNECEKDLNNEKVQRCLQAIEKSNQFWTTFTINRHNIIAHCFALKRIFDEDEARELYHAATQEKLAILNFLRKKLEDDHATMQEKWVKWQMTSSKIEETTGELNEIAIKQKEQNDDFNVILQDLRHSMKEQSDAHEAQFEKMLSSVEESEAKNIQMLTEKVSKEHFALIAHQSNHHKSLIQSFETKFAQLIKSISNLEHDLSTSFDQNHAIMSKMHGSHLNTLHDAQHRVLQLSGTIQQAETGLNSVVRSHVIHSQSLVEEILRARDIIQEAALMLNETLYLQRAGKGSFTKDLVFSKFLSPLLGLNQSTNKLKILVERSKRIQAFLTLSKLFALAFGVVLSMIRHAIECMLVCFVCIAFWCKGLFRSTFSKSSSGPSGLNGHRLMICLQSINSNGEILEGYPTRGPDTVYPDLEAIEGCNCGPLIEPTSDKHVNSDDNKQLRLISGDHGLLMLDCIGMSRKDGVEL